MASNLQNGGLIAAAGNALLISDIHHYKGTYIDGQLISPIGWFMNTLDRSVYYSDQTQGHAICRLDLETREDQLLLDKPCSHLQLSGEWLYFLEERDQCLYRCTLSGSHATKRVDEKVSAFLVENGEIICSTAGGIKLYSEAGTQIEVISEGTAGALISLDSFLVYADKRNRNKLTILNRSSGVTVVSDNIEASSMNTDGRYLYCANRLNGNTLYRVDPDHGGSIRISGESADYIHLINDHLYFSCNREWRKLSLFGGEAQSILL